MGVTRILLLMVAVLFALLALLQVINLGLIAGSHFWQSVSQGKKPPSWIYHSMGELAQLIVPTVISYLAARDLKAVPISERQRFHFRKLGILGWLGMILIVGSLFLMWNRFSIWRALIDVGAYNVDDAVEALFEIIKSIALSVWMGTLCLYARYRIAANNRGKPGDAF